ncbi:tetratricopeptide repeat protein [Sulfuriferula nivalis]|uniref:Sel1 repeat family protein n=1 Tax=Sulfuriferula nivalis TaxID=2675298 RepID=A0A809SIT7_9PROT|nr:tetratricopeptide repeat protein [Sulfuriferula nivalis]BBP02460.1 hypothetical protein SFSGTM_31680 [Sulfuriferula nivalis]
MFKHHLLRTSLFATVLVLSIPPIMANADGLRTEQADALEASAARGDVNALTRLRLDAQQGDSKAQFELALLYENRTQLDQAAEWLQKAANQGYARAQDHLGVQYFISGDVPYDACQAAAWWRKAADQGDMDAQTNLGGQYFLGEGVPQSFGQAAAWWRKAADQGYARAQYDLGVLYALGHGVAQDSVIAYALFNLAAIGNYKNAAKLRDEDSANMTDAQISEGLKLTQRMRSIGVMKTINGL